LCFAGVKETQFRFVLLSLTALEMDYRMTQRFAQIYNSMFAGIALLCITSSLAAQSVEAGRDRPGAGVVAENTIPDAPQPQSGAAPQAQAQKPDAASPADSASSNVQASSQETQPNPQKSKEELAEEQLKQQKKQRVFGFLPSFNTSYNDQAISLTAKQKFKLAFTQATDPVQFAIAAFVSGISQAEGSDSGYGGGIGGYAKRFGADYADSFDGAMIGNAILPSILHQDPRFFRRGYGSTKRRIFYAISTSFMCKHDVTGKWEPNYSNILGNLAAGGISNLYVPKDERGVGNVFEGAALVTVEGGAGAILQEFWPDISRHFFHKDPTNGRDAANSSLRK
jgi:hypothetical protein